MKILIATDGMDIGGAETHVFTLINELKRRGIDVTLISAGGPYADILEKSGVRCIKAPLNKRDPISIRRSKIALSKAMRQTDIVHAHTRFTAFIAKSIRGAAKYPKIVTTAHLNFPLFPFGAFAFWGDGTLAVSEDIREYLMTNYGLTPKDVCLTKNALDVSAYQKARLDTKVIIHTSRIDTGRSKAAFLLVEVARDVLSRHPDWRILIVGDGNRFARLIKKAKETNYHLGFEGVCLCGARSDVPSLLSYGSIFVGVSRAALEGMAAGLPTILCGDEGYGGIVNNDNFSLLSYANFCARGLESATKDALTRDIEILISDKILREELGNSGRETIKKLYPARSLGDDALALYKRVFSPISVCLMGFFGYNNLGDEETLRCTHKALNDMGINDICVLSASESDTGSTIPIKAVYDRRNPRDVISAIERSDAFILCGGNLMQNETSLRSLVYYEQITELARRRGKRILALSSGFGEIHGKIAETLLKRGIERCDFCGCRTSTDLDIAMKYNARARIMPDICFLLPGVTDTPKKCDTFVWIISKRRAVTTEEIESIARSRALTPIAVSLFESADKSALEEVKKAEIKVLTPSSYDELKDTLSSARFSISERLHGSIFSVISHTPTYITTDNAKNRAALHEIEKRAHGSTIILPYTEESIKAKKEIGACDSDFNYVVNSLRLDIDQALNEVF